MMARDLPRMVRFTSYSWPTNVLSLMSFSLDVTISDNLATLFSHSLAQRNGRTDSFSIHPLVHSWARERLSPAERHEGAHLAVAAMLQAIVVQHRRSNKWNPGRMLPHMYTVQRTAATYMEQQKGSAFEEFWDMSCLALMTEFLYHGREKEAEELGLESLEAVKRALGFEYPDSLAVMSCVALTFSKQGRLTEAEVMASEVVRTRIPVLKIVHPDTMLAIGSLAEMFGDQGRLIEAEKIMLEILTTRTMSLEIEYVRTLGDMVVLSLVCAMQGKWLLAKYIVLHVRKAIEWVPGGEELGPLAAMCSLAVIACSKFASSAL